MTPGDTTVSWEYYRLLTDLNQSESYVIECSLETGSCNSLTAHCTNVLLIVVIVVDLEIWNVMFLVK